MMTDTLGNIKFINCGILASLKRLSIYLIAYFQYLIKKLQKYCNFQNPLLKNQELVKNTRITGKKSP